MIARRSRHKALLTGLIAVLPFIVIADAQAATPKPGSICKKFGVIQKANGLLFTCVKSGKKLVWSKGVAIKKSTPSASAKSPSPLPSPSTSTGQVTWNWMDNQGKWEASGPAPACTFPIIPVGSLLDFSKPISLLQPGQTRGGSYKPHGGFRWSVYGTYVPNVEIRVPFNGVVVSASQYKTEGIYQFGVNIINPCGFMVRLGHLHIPSDQFSKILSILPAAVEMDSRETNFNPPVSVKASDVIAIGVGMPAPASPDSFGTFIDFGLLDLRHVNPVLPVNFSSNADPKYSKYSLCWYQGNYLAASDRALVEKLPLANGDPTSEYCNK